MISPKAQNRPSAGCVPFILNHHHDKKNSTFLPFATSSKLLVLGGGTLEVETAAWVVPTLSQRRVSIEMPSFTRLFASNDDPIENATSSGSQEMVEPASVKEEPKNPPPSRLMKRQEAPALSNSDLMRVLGTSPRRIVVSFLSASGIALAGNLLGVTSRLLTTIPEDMVESSGLDTYFPRGDFKRCRGRGYTFVIPKEWLADTFVELAKAQRQTQSLDYTKTSRNNKSNRGEGTLPDAAFGPPGRLNKKGGLVVSEQGDTNVSVIVSTGLTGFSLQGTLGTSPTRAAETLLSVSLAPPGSGRVATLVDAVEDKNRGVYQFEYTVDRGERGPPLRNISVIGAGQNGDTLVTLTVVAPLKDWTRDEAYAAKLRKVASSFHLTN